MLLMIIYVLLADRTLGLFLTACVLIMQSKHVDLVPSIDERIEVTNIQFLGVYQKNHHQSLSN